MLKKEIKNELLACCKQLKLSRNMADNSELVEAECREEYLLRLLKLEVEHREKSRKDRLLKAAGFYSWKTFDGYRFDDVKLPSGVTPEYLARAGFVEEKKNLILYGNVGTGKTHLATAIGIEACRRGLSTGFHRTASLVNRLSEAKKTGRLGKLMASLSKLDLLICDEWGYVPLDREAAQLLFQIISDSYERRSVILTINLEFSRWVGIFYDEQMTAAIIDRLVHHSCLLLFDGPSNRVRDSLMRREGMTKFPTPLLEKILCNFEDFLLAKNTLQPRHRELHGAIVTSVRESWEGQIWHWNIISP